MAFLSDTNIHSIDGVSVWTRTTMKTLASEGHTACVICPISSENSVEREENVYTIGPTNVLNSYPSYAVVGQPIRAITRITKILEKEKPDVIHSNTPLTIGLGASYASRILNIPLVGTLHTLLPELVKHYPPLRHRKLAEILGWRLYYHFYNLCDCVTCPTPTVKKILLEKGVRKRILLLPNGVDTDRFSPSESTGRDFRERLGISTNQQVILFSGRLSFEKRLGLLVMAFKKLQRHSPETFLLVLGDGPQKASLVRLVRKLNMQKRVLFLGKIEHGSGLITAIYNAADVVVLPSAFETQSLSILEAMACSKTVIAAEAGGVKDLVMDKYNGILLRSLNILNLASALRDTLSNDQLRNHIGKAARETAEDYSITLTTQKLTRIYKDLCLIEDGKGSRAFKDIPHASLFSTTFLSAYSLFHVLQRLKMI